MVKFKHYIDQYEIEKADNYVVGRHYKESTNRRLRKIERYMKVNNLLFKDEFLEFSNQPKKHLRIPFIEAIAREKEWIYPDENLKIVY